MKHGLDFSQEPRNLHVISNAEKCLPEINAQVLRTPHGWYRLTPTEKVAIGVCFKNLLGLAASSKLITKYLPDRVERWGKIRFKGVRETDHNASFARVSP